MRSAVLVCCLLLLSVTSSFSQEIFGAVMSGDLDKTKALLEEHPEWLNATSWGGWTPLHRASLAGHKDIVDFLISKGATLDQKSDLGMTPLYLAIYEQKEETARLLIDKGADIFAIRDDGETMLHIAAAVGSKSIAELLIASGLDANVKRRYGITPLHLASVFGHEDVAEALISMGAEINIKSDNGSTPYSFAVASGETQTAALLRDMGAEDTPEEYVKITGEYLGQKQPGSIPEPFAPGILLNVHRPHGGIALSPDGTEIYWTAALTYGTYQKIWVIRQEDGQWGPPKAVQYPPEYTYGAPAFSPDGQRLFLNVSEPVVEENQPADHDICFLERDSTGWSDVVNPGPPLNSDKSEVGPSAAGNGNIYFQSYDLEGGFGAIDVYRSRFADGGYEKPENLGDSINSTSMDIAPFIAPDESYLLFSSFRPGGYGDFDIYVSYKKKDGTWTEARNLGEGINTPARESTCVVSPDGRFLFFISRRNGIGEYFWVNAKIVEDLKPEESK
jgi:ankyrin repeat protein